MSMITTPTLPTGTTNRYGRHWPKTALRVGFGLVWLIDATLKWLPGFRSGYMDTIMGQADGQPGWLKPWFRFWINLQHPDPALFSYLVAGIETAIAVAVVIGFARKITYTAAIVFSLLIWATAEGFGGPYTSGAADVGTALIYAMVFAALLSFSYYQGPAPYAVDSWLEQRIGWWHWVAEVGHHDEARPSRPSKFSKSAKPSEAPVVEQIPLPADLVTDPTVATAASPHHAAHRSNGRVPAGRS